MTRSRQRRLLAGLLGLLLLFLAFPVAEASAGQLVFMRGNQVWAMQDDGVRPRALIKRVDKTTFYELDEPAIAGDGTVSFQGFNSQFTQHYNDPSNAALGVHYGFGATGLFEWDGGAPRRLSVPQSFCFNCTTLDTKAAPAADGRVFYEFQICLGAVGGASQPFRCDGEIRTVTRGKGADRAFGQACEGDSTDRPRVPTPNPRDPREIAYVGCEDGSGAERVFVSRARRAGERAIGTIATDGDDPDLAWRPDGGEIVVRGLESDTVAGLYAFLPGGGSRTKVIDEPSGVVFDSPTYVGSRRIVFGARTSDGNAETPDPRDLYSIPASCRGCAFPSAARRLTRDGKSSKPAWTPLSSFSPVQGASARGRGRSLAVRVSLVRKAKLSVTVRRGSRRLGTVTRRLRAGRRSFRITRVRGRRLAPGRYALDVKAPRFPALTVTARVR